MKKNLKLSLSIMLAICVALTCAIATKPTTTSAAVQVAYYVDYVNGKDTNNGLSPSTPFKYLSTARDAVRTVNSNMTADIIVYLMGSEYVPGDTIAFDDRDSGTNGYNIIYKPYNNTDFVITGGRKITGWTLYDSTNNIYKATYSGTIDTRQLFVNGVRATRARSNVGLTSGVKTLTGYTCSNTALASYKNQSNIEFVYYQGWTNPRVVVDSITSNGTTATVTMQQPGFTNASNKGGTSITLPVYIENAYELIDTEGEWYLDKTGAINGTPNTFYYKPLAGENMNTTEVIAPYLENIFTVQGRSATTPVHNIKFEGLNFKYTTWLRPSTAYGLSDAQNCVIREDQVATERWTEFVPDGAAISLKYSKNITIDDCGFYDLGCIGILSYAGCINNTIQNSTFKGISAHGIQLGDYRGYLDPTSENYCQGTNPNYFIKGNVVKNNYFYACALEYKSATAIGASFPDSCVFSNNEVDQMNYSGVHFGWGWNNITWTNMQNNLIEYNRVMNVMKTLNDGGCIYVLGPQKTYSTISNNYISGCSNQGLYFDGGSSYYHVYDNVIINIGDRIVKITGTNKHDIDVVRTYSNKDVSLEYTAPNVTVEQSIKPDAYGYYPVAANNIMSNAGLSVESLNQKANYVYECENLQYTASAGDTVSLLPDTMFSNGYGLKLASNAVGDYIQFTVNVPKAGKYSIYARTKKYTTRGKYQLSIDGTVVNSTSIDLYDTDSLYQDIYIGAFTFTSAGTKTFKLTATTKNGASSGYDMYIDYIRLLNLN